MATPHAPDSGTILGVDIGGTKTALMAARSTGERLATVTFETPCEAGPSAIVARLRREADAMLAREGIDRRSVRALGCAVPGKVDDKGHVISAGNLKGWSEVPLRRLLHAEWGVPTFVDQDANAGALGEMWRGEARELNDFVFLALGTGVGAGLVLGRRVYRGAHHAAGELGDVVFNPRTLGRGSTDRDNLAAHLGSRALRTRARDATGNDVRAADVVSTAESDSRLAGVARDMTADVAIAVIALAAILDPEAIILGGGTAAHGDELLARVRERVKPELSIEPILVLARLGEEAQLYGAIVGAISKLDPNFAIAMAAQRPQ